MRDLQYYRRGGQQEEKSTSPGRQQPPPLKRCRGWKAPRSVMPLPRGIPAASHFIFFLANSALSNAHLTRTHLPLEHLRAALLIQAGRRDRAVRKSTKNLARAVQGPRAGYSVPFWKSEG